MTGKGLICRLESIQDIEGADKIGKVEMFGETIIVSKEYKESKSFVFKVLEGIIKEKNEEDIEEAN